MRQTLAALCIGGILGAGLAVSQMMNPAKVISFLDFFGDWDPTLAFVLLGAVLAAVPGFWLAKTRPKPILGEAFAVPTRRDIDKPLILGAILFGVGWGLAGFCPGPAIAALTTGLSGVMVFFAAMTAGMMAFQFFSLK